MKKFKKTLVISASPGTGKSYFHNSEEYSNYETLDSDSSLYSWVYTLSGEKTDKRNPNFPHNYIEHIKENIGKVDIIFVSSHIDVRKALTNEGIQFVSIVPSPYLRGEYIERYKSRGSDEKFINMIRDKWFTFIEDYLYNKNYPGDLIVFLKENEYIGSIARDGLTIVEDAYRVLYNT